MLTLSPQWVRIDEEQNPDGESTIPRFAKMVRTQGGMIIGRIVRSGTTFLAEKWKAGTFIDLGSFTSVEEAFIKLESNP